MADTSKDNVLAEFRRFLYMGDETELYPTSVSFPFKSEKIQSVFDISTSEEDAIREILRIYRDGHFLDLEPIIYALAVFSHSKVIPVKNAAFKAVAEVCASASSMFTFHKFHIELSKPAKGYGRSHRSFLKDWYHGKDLKDLMVEVTRVKSRHKWSHEDILRQIHLKPKNPGYAALIMYLLRGYVAVEKDFSSEAEAEPILSYLKALHDLNTKAVDAETAARLIECHDLCLDQIPSESRKTKEVALCLISRVPVKNLLKLIPLYCRLGFLKLNSPHYKALLERLGSEEALSDASIDPLESFLAIRRWQLSNRICPGKSLLRQNTPAIDDALQNLHLESFKAVIPTQKRYLVAVDIRPSMLQSPCGACKCVTPSNLSEIVLLALVKAELSNVTAVVFSSEELVQVDINNKMTISDVKEHLHKVPPGSVNLCSVPQWALTKKKPYDVFIVMTDSFIGSYRDGWLEAFKEYKDTLHLPNTRYIVASFSDCSLSVLENDPNILNVIGFNIKLLKIIQDFARGVF